MPRSYISLMLCFLILAACGQKKALEPADLRGLSKEDLQAMREDILAGHEDGSPLSDEETFRVEELRDQERRLENSWIFGEWQERHGARLIFRDDGSVSVGSRGGEYDELGVYKFISPEKPSFESQWTLVYDSAGDPVALVGRPDGSSLVYRFHRSRNRVLEEAGDLQTSSETGCIFTKVH